MHGAEKCYSKRSIISYIHQHDTLIRFQNKKSVYVINRSRASVGHGQRICVSVWYALYHSIGSPKLKITPQYLGAGGLFLGRHGCAPPGVTAARCGRTCSMVVVPITTDVQLPGPAAAATSAAAVAATFLATTTVDILFGRPNAEGRLAGVPACCVVWLFFSRWRGRLRWGPPFAIYARVER